MHPLPITKDCFDKLNILRFNTKKDQQLGTEGIVFILPTLDCTHSFLPDTRIVVTTIGVFPRSQSTRIRYKSIAWNNKNT